MKLKKSFITLGIGIGIAASVTAMGISSRNSEAAVAVHDMENIKQAIKIATDTLNILTNEEAQLALDILNSTSLDPQRIVSIIQKHSNAQKSILAGDANVDPQVLARAGKNPGILNRNTTTDVILNNIGTIQDVFDGNVDIHDVTKLVQNNIHYLDSSYKDAAKSAENVRTSDSQLNASVQEALKASNEAKGHMQVEQANASINAAQVQSIQNGNEILANMLAIQAQQAYTQNFERAAAIQQEQEAASNMKKYVESTTFGGQNY